MVFATGAPPPVDSLWAANAAEVIEYAHAFAPQATIVLIETLDASQPQLMKASGSRMPSSPLPPADTAR